jgi:hypothetical protein
LLKSLVLAAFCAVAPALVAQQPPRAAGVMRTADVDLGYGVYGEQRGNALPVIAVNGGPWAPARQLKLKDPKSNCGSFGSVAGATFAQDDSGKGRFEASLPAAAARSKSFVVMPPASWVTSPRRTLL